MAVEDKEKKEINIASPSARRPRLRRSLSKLADKKPTSNAWVHMTRLELAGRRQTVYNIIHKLHSLDMAGLKAEAGRKNIDVEELKSIIHELRQKGLIYSPKPGQLAAVD